MSEFNFKTGIDIITASNGNGKSSIIDALTYNLFGKPYRKIKLGNLINNKNGKELYTELEFDVDDISYKIVRGMRPNIFEISTFIDGEYKLINQDSTSKDYQNILENEILMINETVFRQLIVLGANVSNSRNFMDLNPTEKEEVFQVVTDTSLFKHLNDIIKSKRNELKTILTEHNYQFDILSSTIESERQTVVSMQKQNAFLQQNKDNRINEMKKFIEEGKLKLLDYDKAIEKLKELKSKYDDYMSDLELVKTDIKNLKDESALVTGKKIAFEHMKEASIICDRCEHEILPEGYDDVEYQEALKRLDIINESLKKKQEVYVSLIEKTDSLKEKLLNSKRITQNRSELISSLEKKENELKDIETWEIVEIDTSSIEAKEKELTKVKSIISDAENKHAALNQLMKLIGGDNLKGYILSKQIPLLNKYINGFIEKFSDFNFNFVIDNNFKEQFISRNESQEFHSFSNGQKQRFTFAILFAFLKLIEERSGVSTNLLAMDEILDSSADSSGRSELLDILYNNFSDKKNIIIISHQPEIRERTEIINRTFEVHNNGFSKLVEVTS
jgi:DNA repair exonuclease SbcCD ATPase subunit